MATTKVPNELVMKAWAKDTWDAGMRKAFFNKFTGKGADNIVQIKEELKKGKGDSINIPLLMPLKGAGVTGDNKLEGNEEALIYRSFDVKIDQIRNAVLLEGKMEEQKTQLDLRGNARSGLSDWLATHIDKAIFNALYDNPSADRTIYAGAATSAAGIGATDVFNTDIIGKAKRMALADEDTMVKPVKVDGRDTYVMVIDQWQARDLRKDERWFNAQKDANLRGKDNPIFTGALGVYDGVVVHECNRILRTGEDSGTKIGHALFLGAQAAVMAVGNDPFWVEKAFDYDNQVGFSFGRIFGIKKSAFKYDGVNDTDFGVINVLTSSVDD